MYMWFERLHNHLNIISHHQQETASVRCVRSSEQWLKNNQELKINQGLKIN